RMPDRASERGDRRIRRPHVVKQPPVQQRYRQRIIGVREREPATSLEVLGRKRSLIEEDPRLQDPDRPAVPPEPVVECGQGEEADRQDNRDEEEASDSILGQLEGHAHASPTDRRSRAEDEDQAVDSQRRQPYPPDHRDRTYEGEQ